MSDENDRHKRRNPKSHSNPLKKLFGFGLFQKKESEKLQSVQTPPCDNFEDLQMKTCLQAYQPPPEVPRVSASRKDKSRRSGSQGRDPLGSSGAVRSKHIKSGEKKDKDECDIEEVVKDEKVKTSNALRDEDVEKYVLLGRKIIDEEFIRQVEEAAKTDSKAKANDLPSKTKKKAQKEAQETKADILHKRDKNDDNLKSSPIVKNEVIPVRTPQYEIEYRLVQGRMVARYVPKK